MVGGQARGGRPRSERARRAVLHAVDDLLVEVGYSAMTMKGIAERAGVGRQTVYRWWSHKAEILFEASVEDAQQELAVAPSGDPLDELATYLDALVRFLTTSHAGTAYRVLIGESQHDPAVEALLASRDVLMETARPVVARALGAQTHQASEQCAALLVGPIFFSAMTGRGAADLDTRALAGAFLRAVEPVGS